MTIYDVLQIVCNCFAMIYISRFMAAFFDSSERRNSKWFALLYLICPISTTFVYFFMNYPILNLCVNLFSLTLISFQFRTEICKRIVSVGMTYFCMLGVETMCAVCTNYLNISAFQIGTYQNILGLVVSNFLLFMISLFIYHWKNMQNFTALPKSLWISIACIPLLSIFAITVLLQNGRVTQFQSIFIITTLFIVNSCTFYLYDALIATYNAQLKAVLLEEEKECYYNQCKYMEHTERELRAFRHDIKNQLDLFYSLLQSNFSEEAEACVKKLEEKLDQNESFSETGNLALDSILNLKLTQARGEGITVSCKSNVPKNLLLDFQDLMVILGNLLDNAIDASKKLQNEAFISVVASYDKGMLFLFIQNAYDGRLEENGGQLQTTKAEKDLHGYGLRNVRDVLERYHGMMNFQHENRIFTVEVALYCRDMIQERN